MFTTHSVETLKEKISAALASDLLALTYVLPDIEDRITDNILWGIFSTTLSEGSDYQVPYTLIKSAETELLKSGQEGAFFAPGVAKALEDKNLSIEVDREDMRAQVDIVSKANVALAMFQIFPTLPDSDVVFGELLSKDNSWLYDYIDMYDDWKCNIMSEVHNYTYQIGGHGRWIQGDYNGQYVGQLNLDIGDAGSVFIYVSESEFSASIDMF